MVERRGERPGVPVRGDAPQRGVFVDFPGCMGLIPQIDRGGGRAERRDLLVDGGREARLIREPGGSVGVLHDHEGDPQIASDLLHPGGEGAMLPGVAITARRAAALAAVHPAACAAPDRRGAAGLPTPGAGARAAAGSRLQDCHRRSGITPGA